MTPGSPSFETAFKRVVNAAFACAICTGCVVCDGATLCAPTLPGANVAGGEFNAGKRPGTFSRDYIYPGPKEIALLKQLDLKLIRVPFLWERLQRRALQALDPDELARIDKVVALATSAGLTVVLDVHNYGAYEGRQLDSGDVPSGALPDLWGRLAEHYQDHADVAFGIMNEPNKIGVQAWATIARDTLSRIRSTGARNVVLIPGTIWDGAHSWFKPVNGVSNADSLRTLARGDDRVVFEVHQYFDDDFSGTKESCNAAGQVPQALERVGTWARDNHVRLFLGEFGSSARPECIAALEEALKVVEKDRSVWYGWAYWAAGAWWNKYPFNIQTADGATPQGDVLKRGADALRDSTCAS